MAEAAQSTRSQSLTADSMNADAQSSGLFKARRAFKGFGIPYATCSTRYSAETSSKLPDMRPIKRDVL